MAALKKPSDCTPVEAKRIAGILTALATDLEEGFLSTPPLNRVGIHYGDLVPRRAKRAVIASIQFRARAYQQRWDKWVESMYREVD